MDVCFKVAETGSPSAAGLALTLTPSAVTKFATRIEVRLGVALIQ